MEAPRAPPHDLAWLADLLDSRWRIPGTSWRFGVDVVAGDRYGRFALTDDGLRARERRVLGWARGAGLPLVITLAGGYAASAERTAALHAVVFEEAAR